jgi:diguanylate cyclase (GGDEF)-like protein
VLGKLRQRGSANGADPFRGAQHDVAVRVTGALWVIGPVLTLTFLPFYPPTAQIGALGWLLVCPMTVASIVFGYLALRLKVRLSWDRLYFSSFNGVAQIALLQWLAGGGDAPFLQWLILPSIAVATQRTAGWCVPVLIAAAAAAFSPLLYSGIDVPGTIAETTLISAMTIIVAVVMTSVREHRAELRDVGEHAASLARRDALTGLPNRRSFEEVLDQTVESFSAQGRPLSLLLCDVNDFKEINDTFGHPAGDTCLRAIADALGDGLQPPDQAFRWAGDEFAVLLHDTHEQGAAEAEVRVAQAMKLGCQRPDGAPITVGVGSAQLSDGMTADHFLAAADVALLERKAARRRVEASPSSSAGAPAVLGSERSR